MRTQRTVAILSPDFAPCSLPSSLRARLFASHLEEFGWRPIVIATAPEYYECAVDPDNERLLPANLEVIRTRALPAARMRQFGVGDVGIRSLRYHWQAIRQLYLTRSVDLLFITVPPYVSMILGGIAHRHFGIPYVIDYQDPWVTEVYWSAPRAERPPKWPLAYGMARLLEPSAVRHASHITAVSQGTIDSVLARYPKMHGVGTTALPFGAEPADFAFLRDHPRKNRFFDPGDGNLHLVYAGVCIPAMYPALRCLFGGLRQLRERNPDLVARMRLHFVGTNYAAQAGAKRVEPVAAEFGVEDLVSETPARVDYLDALQLLLDAGALLIVGTNEPHYTASKLYPYAISGRPIFAIFHEQSSAVDSLHALSPSARILTFSDERPAERQTELAAAQLEALVSDRAYVPPAADISEHTARAMTQKLARVFDQVMEARA